MYALYRNKRLYYVGLARTLRTRVNQDLKGKHSNKGDTSSLFSVEKAEHLKELESLILREDSIGLNLIERGRHAKRQV